jgi:hypothetical protein
MTLPKEQADALVELEALLQRQIRLLSGKNLPEVQESMGQARKLLARLSPLASEPTGDDRRRLQRVEKLHRKLQLTLHDQFAETRSELKRISHGRAGLSAYGR